MKKTLFFALCSSFALQAQVREKGDIEIAPFVGYSAANYYGDIGFSNDAVENPYVGINAEYYLNNRWSLRTGVEYKMMGSSGYTDFFFNDRFEENLDFVSVPLHAGYHFGKTRKWYLNFGPTVDFLTKAESNGRDISYGMNTVQVGIGVGIGYKIYINERFSIGVDHQEYISVVNNLKDSSRRNDAYIANYFGSFNVKAVFKLGRNTSKQD